MRVTACVKESGNTGEGEWYRRVVRESDRVIEGKGGRVREKGKRKRELKMRMQVS